VTSGRILQRIAGMLLVMVFLFGYAPDSTTLSQRLWLPLLGGIGAYLVVQNLLAVALGVALLAGIGSAPGSSDPLNGIVFPLLAAAAASVACAILWRRFAAAMRDTRAARQAARARRTPSAPD
jgi:hypothetical protein